MKRLMAFGLALCMGVTALTGCTDGSATATTAAAGTQTEQTGKAGDKAQEGAAAGTSEASGESGEEGKKAASGIDKLVLTYVVSPLNVPSIIEKNQKIFAQSFEDMGISVEYAEINSGADQTQALASGDVQILYAVGATSVILSAANGADIKVLNMYSRSPKAFCMYSRMTA